MVNKMVENVLANLHMPFNLDIGHFLDKTWGVQLGPDKIHFKLEAGMATELNAKLSDDALHCIVKEIVNSKGGVEGILGKAGEGMALTQEDGITAMEMLKTRSSTDRAKRPQPHWKAASSASAQEAPSPEDKTNQETVFMEALVEEEAQADVSSFMNMTNPEKYMHIINNCLMDNADFSAMLDATGEASVGFFGIKFSLVRAQFTAAASLFPLPLPQGDESWVEAMQNNYRVDLTLSLMDTAIPIYKHGRLVKDFRTKMINEEIHSKKAYMAGNEKFFCEDGEGWTESCGDKYREKESGGLEKVQEGDDEEDDEDPHHDESDDVFESLMQAKARSIGDTTQVSSKNAADIFHPPQGSRGVSGNCGAQTDWNSGVVKTPWKKEWQLGSLEFPIVPGLLTIGISLYAGLGLKVAYNFAPCGGIFDLSVFASGSAVPYAFARAEGQVFIGFAIFKLGILLDIPIISINLPVTAAIGCKLQDMGGLDGFVQVKLVLDPWVFKIKLFIEINFILFKIRLEFTLWSLAVGGFSWTLYKGNFRIPIGHEADTMVLTNTHGDDGLTLPLPDRTPPGVVQKYKVSTVYSKTPYATKGKAAYSRCAVAEDCKSGLCVLTASRRKLCRPIEGFAQGAGCWYSRDCNVQRQEFCRNGGGDASGRCAALGKAMEPCASNSECESGTCAITFGVKQGCVFSDKNCLCRPKRGFPSATHATSALDCESRATKKGAHGLTVCTKADDYLKKSKL
jgi:hypothetical protein